MEITMKTLIIALSTFFISSVSFGCADFSGKYYDGDGSDDNNTFKMFQNGCESIEFDGMSTKFKFDGKDQLFIQIGDSKVFINNRLQADKWIIQTKTVTPLDEGGFGYDIVLTERSLNLDFDIVDVIYYDDGRSSTKIIKRAK